MGRTHDEGDSNEQPTLAGCLLIALCVAVIFGSAVPIVRWRDPISRKSLPTELAIALPILAGGICYGIGSVICRLLGIPVVARRKQDAPPTAEDADRPPGENQTPS
jgi:hypothetical protein